VTFANESELSTSAASGFSDFDQHKLRDLTQSAASMYMKCPQAFVFRYMFGITKRKIAKPLVVGSLVHNGIERILNFKRGVVDKRDDPLSPPASIEDILAKLDDEFSEYVDELASKSDMVSPSEAEDLEYCRVQALACTEAWATMYADSLLEWTIEAAEQEFRTVDSALPGSEYDRLISTGNGKIDALVRRASDPSRLFVLEHKTRSRMDTLNVGSLSLDMQGLWYIAQARARIDKRTVGFLYNVIKKPSHRMSAKGSDELRRRMVKAMLDEPEKYFAFVDIIADNDALRNNLDNMKLVSDQMQHLAPKTVIMNVTACDNYGGCSYRALCREGACVRRPESLASNPAMADYAFAPPHSELSVEGGESDE
jgi:predicted RecB family endonuclease